MEEKTIKTADIIELLFSLGVNYPRIKALGLSLSCPIACIVQSREQVEKIIYNLSPFSSIKQISVCATPKQCEKLLATANSEYVFIHYSKEPRFKKELEIIIYATESGVLGDYPCHAIPFIFFYPEIPEELKESCFLIYLPDDKIYLPGNPEERLLQIISPIENQFSIVEDHIERMDCDSSLEKILRCAAHFLYPYFKATCSNPSERLNYFLGICNYLVEQDSDAKSSSGISDYFIKLIYDWINSSDICNVYATTRRKSCPDKDEILYDKKYLYIPESVFEKIIVPLKELQSSPLLKQTLKNDGLLICDESKSYSSKVITYNSYGAPIRIRALKFHMEAMNQLGEIPLLELCKANAKEEEIL